jgi:hypothetical protein
LNSQQEKQCFGSLVASCTIMFHSAKKILKETEEVVNVGKVHFFFRPIDPQGDGRSRERRQSSFFLAAKKILKETEEVVNVGKVVFWVDSQYILIFAYILSLLYLVHRGQVEALSLSKLSSFGHVLINRWNHNEKIYDHLCLLF